jgi:hypothetical protein
MITPMQYLESLIAGMDISSIPIQKSELELLKKLMEMEQNKEKK